MLRYLLGLSLLLFATGLGSSAFAQTPSRTELLLDNEHECGSYTVESLNSEPLNLYGNGVGCFEGSGMVRAQVSRGLIGVQGMGILAVKGDDYKLLGDWKYGDFEVKEWRIFVGSGSFVSRGSEYSLAGWLDSGKMKFRGDGMLNFEGEWSSVYSDLYLDGDTIIFEDFQQ